MRALLPASLCWAFSAWPCATVVEAAVGDAKAVTTVTVDAPLYDTKAADANGCDPSGCVGEFTRVGGWVGGLVPLPCIYSRCTAEFFGTGLYSWYYCV